MKEYLKKLPQEIQEMVRLAGETAARNGMRAYLVGGFVRDLILNVDNLDLDITVEGDGIKFAEDLANQLEARLVRHRRFGTATVTHRPHLKIDIATARKEYYPHPAHLPEVTEGSLKEDLLRRDFTINAMAIDINADSFGQLIDPFGGVSDLRAKKIRILHDLSFIDDPTRILRAIRFEKRYNFHIEPKSLKLLKEALKRRMLDKVEPQRVRDDLILMLKEKDPIKQIRRLQQLAGLSFIHKELFLSSKDFIFFGEISRQIRWFKKFHFRRRQLDSWLMYLIGMLNVLSVRQITALCGRLSLRSGEEKRIISYKNTTSKFIATLSKANAEPAKIFSLLEPLSYEVILLLKARYKNRILDEHISDFLEIYNGMRILISGDDLRNLGILPGPYYQKIFSRVLTAKLNGLVKNREEELLLIKKIIKA